MGTWEPLLERMVMGRYPQLVAYAMRLAPSRADAEDLVQDALVTTFSGRARFATEAEAEAYVRQAVASRFVDAGRRRSTERRALARHVVQTPVTTVPPPSVGLAPEVEAALALLAPRERACVVLRHMEDLSTRETAQLLVRRADERPGSLLEEGPGPRVEHAQRVERVTRRASARRRAVSDDSVSAPPRRG